MPFQVLRIKKCKGGAIAAAVKHNNRKSPPAHADPAKEHLNRELLRGNDPTVLTYKQIKQSIDQIVDTCPRKIRSDQVKCVELLLSASADFFGSENEDQAQENEQPMEHHWDNQKLQQWTKQSLAFIHKELGPRAISATLHLDELTPHIHVLVVPIHDWEKKNLSCKELFGNRQGFSQWQDKYHHYMKPIGLDRGEKGSLANYQSVRQYHKKMEHYILWENNLNQHQEKLDHQEEALRLQQEQLERLQKLLQQQELQLKRIEQKNQHSNIELERKGKQLDSVQKDIEKERQELNDLQQVSWTQSIVMTIRNNPLLDGQKEQWCDGRYWAEHLDNGSRVLWAKHSSSNSTQDDADKRAILYRLSDGTISPGKHIQQQDALLFQQWAQKQAGLNIQLRHKTSTDINGLSR